MGIYKSKGTWIIDEIGFYQSGFASRDDARKFNADRKNGVAAPASVKTTVAPIPVPKVVSYDPTDVKVDRGTEDKWWFIQKSTGKELEVACSRDGGRSLLADLRNTGARFVTGAVLPTTTIKPTTLIDTTPKTEIVKPVASQVKKGPLACVVSTGLHAVRNSKKFTVGRQPKNGSWKIKVNGAHIGTVNTSYEDACEACKYIMVNRILSI